MDFKNIIFYLVMFISSKRLVNQDHFFETDVAVSIIINAQEMLKEVVPNDI